MRTVNSWSDITVGQYQEISLVQSENPITSFIEKMSIVLDCDSEEIRNTPYSEYQKLQANLEFINTDPEKQIVNWFELDGKYYGLEPDMSLITTGVFIDCEQFKQDPIVNLHNTLALIYRPITSDVSNGVPDEYEIEPHQAKGFEKRSQLFKEKLSIEVVLGAVVFFSLLGTGLSIASLESFSKMIVDEMEITKTKTTQTPTKQRKKKPSKKDMGSTI